MRLSCAIVFVSDMVRSVEFYRDVVGLPLRLESSHWTELETGGATLALHLGEAAERGSDERAGACRPGLAVSDLDAFHQRMADHGVPCVQPPKSLFGARIAQYRDPDGLVISVSEERGAA